VERSLNDVRDRRCRVFARSQFLEKVLDAVIRSDSGSAAEDAEHLLSVLYWLLGQHCLVEDGEVGGHRQDFERDAFSFSSMINGESKSAGRSSLFIPRFSKVS
jgi:hypothetical protein